MDWINYINTDEDRALKEVYLKFRESCCSWISNSYQVNSEDAKEIFQASVVILYDNVKTGKLTVLNSNLKSYLFAIAKNQALTAIRKKKGHTDVKADLLLSNYLIDDTNDPRISSQDVQLVSQQLTVMGDPCRTILQLYYYQNMNLDEITVLMGYKNRSTTKSKKHQCLKRLRERVNQKSSNALA